MKLKLLILSLAIIIVQQSVAQEKASTILKDAYKQAKIEKKNVFVIFHASWCGWCKKMDRDTYARQEIIDYINSKFYPIKFNGEQKDVRTCI